MSFVGKSFTSLGRCPADQLLGPPLIERHIHDMRQVAESSLRLALFVGNAKGTVEDAFALEPLSLKATFDPQNKPSTVPLQEQCHTADH